MFLKVILSLRGKFPGSPKILFPTPVLAIYSLHRIESINDQRDVHFSPCHIGCTLMNGNFTALLKPDYERETLIHCCMLL